MAFGLTSAMYGEITLSEGESCRAIFTIIRFCGSMKCRPVEIYWMLGRNFRGGIGEPVVGLVAPALTNAIYDAGGPRIRSLPIKNHRPLL